MGDFKRAESEQGNVGCLNYKQKLTFRFAINFILTTWYFLPSTNPQCKNFQRNKFMANEAMYVSVANH